jgi:hypothetical protein
MPTPRAAAYADFLARFVGVAVTAAACVAFFFRFQIRNGGRLLNGDRYDGAIETAILEHWHNVLTGHASWSTTHYFFPAPNTLGYNDGYLLFGLVHAALRSWFGLDLFLSSEVVNAVLRAVAFVGFYLAARTLVRAPYVLSLLGAALFTLASNMFLHAYHAQLFAVGLVPVMALLAGAAVRAFLTDRPSALAGWGVLCALLFAAWLLTGYYMAWFFAFFACIAAVVYAASASRDELRAVAALARRQARAIAVVATSAAVFVAPFLWLYLPKARETGMHAYGVGAGYTPTVFDVLDIGSGSLLWGGVLPAITQRLRPGGGLFGEAGTGIPPLLLCAFLVAAIALIVRHRAQSRGRPSLAYVVAAATLVTWLLCLRIGPFSAWWFVYHLVPGAQAVRVVARIQIFLMAPMILVVVCWLASFRSWRSRLALALLAPLLLLEEMNALPSLGLERPQELARLRAIGAPPAPCQAFFVSSAREKGLYGKEVDARYSHNVDAMLVAETTHTPTINGFASFSPKGWDLSRPDEPDYRQRIAAYARAHDIRGLCELDLRALQWNASPPLP